MERPTRDQVMSWDASPLADIAADADKIVQGIDTIADSMRRTISGMHWSGAAATAANHRADNEYQQIRTIASAYDELGTACRTAHSQMNQAIADIKSTVHATEVEPVSVADDWSVLNMQDQNEAENITARLTGLADSIGSAMDTAGKAIATAVDTLAALTPVSAGLSGTLADQDLTDFRNGTATPEELARIQAATRLTPEQKQALADGRPVELPQGQFDYLSHLMRSEDGMTIDDIANIGSHLTPDQQQQLQRGIADSMQLISNPQVHTASIDGSANWPDRGGMEQLPATVRTVLTENPLWTSGPNTTNPYGVMYPGPNVGYGTQLDKLVDIASRGDKSMAQGSDLDRGLIKQASEIATLNKDPNHDFAGLSDDGTKSSALADKMLDFVSSDHQAVHDFITGENMNPTCTPDGSYNAESHVLDVLQNEWGKDQHGAENIFEWIGGDAGAPDQAAQQRAGESAEHLANIISHNEATLAQDMPGRSDHAAFGQVNPGVSNAVAGALKDYIPNFAGVNEPGLLVNHYAHSLDTAGDHHDGVGRDGSRVDHHPGDLSNLFKVIDSNPDAAAMFNSRAAKVAGQLDFQAGTGANPHAAYESAQLTGAMQIGLNDELFSLTKIDHQNTADQQTAEYNKKLEIVDVVTGAVNPTGPVISTTAWVLDPVVKAEIPSPDIPSINEQPTHWSDDLEPVRQITDQNSLYQQTNIVSGYNSTHPGTLELFNTHPDPSGRTYQFFDEQGRPNASVIEANRAAFDNAYAKIVPDSLTNQYNDSHGRGWVDDKIPPIDPQKGHR
ncbi:DUF3945 domain-containing protein [Nocardia sp. NPDC051570]|uniref:TPR repeat region-containing protein n=1 Tax=Nocardia sp. NPDC051570 TaxID=3364324 RepID=UPI00378F251F